MRDALLAGAGRALYRGDLPIGAVIVHENRIVGRGGNASQSDGTRLSHAEMKALHSCAQYLSQHARECVVYTTVEPCVMCLGAIIMVNIRRVVFGAPDANAGAGPMVEHVPYVHSRAHHYLGGVLEEERLQLCQSWEEAFARAQAKA